MPKPEISGSGSISLQWRNTWTRTWKLGLYGSLPTNGATQIDRSIPYGLQYVAVYEVLGRGGMEREKPR